MESESPYSFVNRRKFIQYLAMVGVGGRALLQTGDARAAVYAAKGAAGAATAWPGSFSSPWPRISPSLRGPPSTRTSLTRT